MPSAGFASPHSSEFRVYAAVISNRDMSLNAAY